MYVAFDIGNVLCEINLSVFIQEFELYFSDSCDAMLFLEDLQCDQDVGFTTIRKKINFMIKNDTLSWNDYLPISNQHHEKIINKLCNAWNKILKPSKIMFDFINELKNDNITVALLSNMGSEHAEYIKNTYPDLFNGNITHLSFEVGARKPSNLFFQSFLIDNPDFKNAIYIDDLEENVNAAKKNNFKAKKFHIDNFLKNSLADQKKELQELKNEIKTNPLSCNNNFNIPSYCI